MGGIGTWQIAIVFILILVFFGRGKISEFMGDMGRGVTSFKKGLKEGHTTPEPESQQTLDKPVSSFSETPVDIASKKEAEKQSEKSK